MSTSSKSTDFDPYHKWLGIRKADQPPHHYRLLALDLFEDDPEVIEAAADRQMTYVQQCASGEFVQQSQAILNELSRARVELLNTEKKKAYDAKLRRKLQKKAAKQAEPVRPSEHTVAPEPTAQVRPIKLSKKKRPAWLRRRRPVRGSSTLTLAGIGASIVFLVVVLFSVMGGDDQTDDQQDKTRVAKSGRDASSPKAAEKSTKLAKSSATKTPTPSAKPEPKPAAKTVEEPAPVRATAIAGHGGIPGVEITSGGSVQLATLMPGAKIDSGTSGFRQFDQIPPGLEGKQYTLMKNHKGILKFTVLEDASVLLAVHSSDWGGGGSRGTWYKEVVPRDKLEGDGWREVGKVSCIKFGAFTVFSRDCKADESFAIRTHKYAPPFLISP